MRIMVFATCATLLLTLSCRLPKKRVALPQLPVNEACAEFTVDQQWTVIEATPRISAWHGMEGTEGYTGSGVVIAIQPLSEGRGWRVYVLTAAHVIQGMHSFAVEFFTRDSHPDPDMASNRAQVVNRWENQDLALLIVETPHRPASILPLGSPRRMPKPGAMVLAAGCGDSAPPHATIGILEHRWVMSDLSVSAPMVGGMSGGPLVAKVEGCLSVIGVNRSTSPVASLAVPLEIITLFVQRTARSEPRIRASVESPTLVEPPLWTKRFIYAWFVALSLFLGGRKL